MKSKVVNKKEKEELRFTLSNEKEVLLLINLIEEAVTNKDDKQIHLLSGGLTKDDLRRLQLFLNEAYEGYKHVFP